MRRSWFDHLSQFGQRPVNERANRARAATKGSGDVGVREVAVIAQHYRSALTGREFGHCIFQFVGTKYGIDYRGERQSPDAGIATMMGRACVDDTPTDVGKRIVNCRPSFVQADEAVLYQVRCSIGGPAQECGQAHEV